MERKRNCETPTICIETLWNKAISAEQKINQIEKCELPEVFESSLTKVTIPSAAANTGVFSSTTKSIAFRKFANMSWR